jgi:uncharacterized protein
VNGIKGKRMFLKRLLSVTVLLLLLTNIAYAQLNLEQKAAKERGLMLFGQYKSAAPELRIAAEAGDAEAQFYLAEDIRLEHRYITKEAYKWYVAAANQGDYYAMFQLATSGSDLCSVIGNCPVGVREPGDWLKMLWATARPLAEQGDSEAMSIMYNATAELEWLEKSAEAGYANAQWLLANRYQEGEGFFILPWKRQEAVEKWFKASAEGGFPKAMMTYFGLLRGKNDLAGARYWLEQAAKTGHEGGVYNYGYFLAVEPETLGFDQDLIKGYGLISLLRELDGGGNVQIYVDDVLPKIAAKMTPEQVEEAKVFAKEWKATHPPLSFFPDKLGF